MPAQPGKGPKDKSGPSQIGATSPPKLGRKQWGAAGVGQEDFRVEGSAITSAGEGGGSGYVDDGVIALRGGKKKTPGPTRVDHDLMRGLGGLEGSIEDSLSKFSSHFAGGERESDPESIKEEEEPRSVKAAITEAEGEESEEETMKKYIQAASN